MWQGRTPLGGRAPFDRFRRHKKKRGRPKSPPFPHLQERSQVWTRPGGRTLRSRCGAEPTLRSCEAKMRKSNLADIILSSFVFRVKQKKLHLIIFLARVVTEADALVARGPRSRASSAASEAASESKCARRGSVSGWPKARGENAHGKVGLSLSKLGAGANRRPANPCKRLPIACLRRPRRFRPRRGRRAAGGQPMPKGRAIPATGRAVPVKGLAIPVGAGGSWTSYIEVAAETGNPQRRRNP
jgi:hypothetical protein